jgi:hypothetical protein
MTEKSDASKATVTKLPRRDEAGRVLASDNLPAHAHARAAALKAAGAKTDPLGLVSDELIASAETSAPEKKAAAAAKKE